MFLPWVDSIVPTGRLIRDYKESMIYKKKLIEGAKRAKETAQFFRMSGGPRVDRSSSSQKRWEQRARRFRRRHRRQLRSEASRPQVLIEQLDENPIVDMEIATLGDDKKAQAYYINEL